MLIEITPPIADLLVSAGIGGIAALMAYISAFVYSNGNYRRIILFTLGLAAMMGASALAAFSGVLARFDIFPPPMILLLVGIFAVAFSVGVSRLGKSLADETSWLALVSLQIFRLPLELLMHRAAQRGIMPLELSYSGYNLDIVTGATALLLAILLSLRVRIPKAVIWGWNLWGMLCLLVIVIVALASSPLLHVFGTEPAHLNTWVLFFPYVWLPAILVMLAITGHLIITRKLLRAN